MSIIFDVFHFKTITMTNLFKAALVSSTLLLAGLSITNLSAQSTYFAATGAGAGNTGPSVTGVGYFTLSNSNSGAANSAFGSGSLSRNTSGAYNTGAGYNSILNNSTGFRNSSYGVFSLYNNTTGSNSCAFGFNALYSNVTASHSCAFGFNALANISTGGYNVGIGAYSGYNFVSMSNSVFVGYGADATVNNLTNAMALGNGAQVNASNKVVIGNTAITSIGGQVGWTVFSDRRLKTNINKSTLGLDFILSLIPVTYNYKAEGQKGIVYTGLIAQEVDEAAKKAGVEFSGVDKNGEYWGIRYAELTVPLIKSMQELNDKAQAENEQLKTRIEKLETAIAFLQQGIKPSTVLSSSMLFQNQPNPFNKATTINFMLASSDKSAAVVIRNINGAVVKQVSNIQSGKGSIIINASELAAGTYTYSLITNGNVVDTKLMVITK